MCKFLTAAGLILCLAVLTAHGDDTEPALKSSKPPKRESLPLATPEREAAALMFVRMNHPELADVLTQLKSSQPAEYDKAIRELFKTCEQLNRIRDNDPRKFELDLEAWKIKSRIQLLVAKAGLSADDTWEQPLRESVERQAEIRLQQLALQREQAAQRLARLDEQLAEAKNNRQSHIDKQLTGLKRSVQKGRAAAKKQTPAGNTPANANPAAADKPKTADK